MKERIMEAARSLFVAEGYDAVTMREIARRIGYTATALYYHFPNKHALVTELCARDFLALAEYLRRIGRVPDPVERIRRMGLAYIRFGLEFPQHYRLMFMTVRPPVAPTSLERGNTDQDAYAFLRAAVGEAFQAERFRAGLKEPEAIAQVLWAGVHGVVSLLLTKGQDPWIAWVASGRLARLQTDALLRGLLRERRAS